MGSALPFGSAKAVVLIIILGNIKLLSLIYINVLQFLIEYTLLCAKYIITNEGQKNETRYY